MNYNHYQKSHCRHHKLVKKCQTPWEYQNATKPENPQYRKEEKTGSLSLE